MTDWSDFPASFVEPTTPLYRIHQKSQGACYFGTSSLHRFDPLPARPPAFGVCYLALEPLAAFVEVFGRVRTVQRSEVESRCLSTARVTRDLRLADLTNREVLGRFRVTAAHSTGSDYESAQLLSDKLHAAGFDGVLYRIRHDPDMRLEAVALCGEPEASVHDAIRWGSPSPIPGSLIHQGRQFGIDAVPQWADF